MLLWLRHFVMLRPDHFIPFFMSDLLLSSRLAHGQDLLSLQWLLR